MPSPSTAREATMAVDQIEDATAELAALDELAITARLPIPPAQRASVEATANLPGIEYSLDKHIAREARRAAHRASIAIQDREARYSYGLHDWLAYNERGAAIAHDLRVRGRALNQGPYRGIQL